MRLEASSLLTIIKFKQTLLVSSLKSLRLVLDCVLSQQPVPARQGEDIAQAKRRRLGRVQKTIGDFCLLAGSPLDAHAHYATAIELARTTFDNFWLAGALEGHVSALVVER